MSHAQGKIVYSYYEIVGLVGQGGMGAVYQARDLRDMGMVALKQMREDTSAGFGAEKMREKFEQEWQILKSLDHRRIPRMLSAFHEDDSIYYVMEFIEGKSLATKVRELKKQGKRFPEILLLEYTLQLLDVLEYLHARTPPVLHRDLKPENVIVRDSDGEIVLVDFGLARGISASAGANTQTQVGTLGFAALEQVKGKPEIRSDIYGVGATMWYMLTGDIPQPFDIQPIEEMRNDLFPGISEIVNRACQTNPGRRFATASRMELAVRQALANLQGVPLDSRAEQLFIDEAPIPLSVPKRPMSAAMFLVQAFVGVLVILGGIFFLGAMRDQMIKPVATRSSAASPTAEPIPGHFVNLPVNDRNRSDDSEPISDYAILSQTQPLRAKLPTPDLVASYRDWPGPGWELTGVGGEPGSAGSLATEAEKPLFMVFHNSKKVKLSNLNLSLSRTGASPSTLQLILGTVQQPQMLSLICGFQSGRYFVVLAAAGKVDPKQLELPRHPYEELTQVAVLLSQGVVSASVEPAGRVQISYELPAVDSLQIIVPPANKAQSMSVNSLNLFGQ